jgi:hypothetical protein
MSKDESEIGGGKGRHIQVRAARGTQRALPKRRSFTLQRRQQFLDHFAASCNATAAARAVKVSRDCVYRWRRTDAQFRAAWKDALDQGYAELEAELVRESRRVLSPRASKRAGSRISGMDAKTALAVLNAYRRSGGRDPGTVWPQPYDVEAVRARLEAKMLALGMIEAKKDSGGSDPVEARPRQLDPGGKQD